MNNKDLAISLSKCENEQEIISLLKAENLWEDKNRWRAFGDNDNNWSTIGNQQSYADAALVEKIVNSVDALLMKECLLKRIDPTSPKAPQSIPEALELFFGITGGKIQNLTESERTKLAQDNIIFAATGMKTKPNYVIVDCGEGQTPTDMPNTILSINKSNKLKVPFVQGKFNMGGTGVLCFCGDNNFQLIISKRCPDICNYKNDTDSLWGFTIIRRERPYAGTGLRSSEYTYLVDSHNDIMTFKADTGIAIIPSSKKDPNGNTIYNTMHYGMYCKMYEYKIPGRLATNINMGLSNRLSMLLPNLAYPVYLDECRDYKAHTLFRTLSGLNVRLSDQWGQPDSNIEDKVSTSFHIQGQKIDATIYVFKDKTPSGNRIDMSQYRLNEGVLLTQNGQTHGSYDKQFYSRTSVGLSYLADSLLTVIDCSGIDEATREELFMNSRDRTRSSSFAVELEHNLEEQLKQNETLKQIQAYRREQAVSERLDDQKPLEDVLSSVFKASSVLSKLFILGQHLQNPIDFSKAKAAEEYQGKYNPTFFTLLKQKKGTLYSKQAQLDRKFRIQFKTDANNDFFTRDKYPGTIDLLINGEECNDTYFLNLRDGIATLNVDLPSNAKCSETFTYEFLVKDTNNENEFKNTFIITVVENKTSTSESSGNRIPPSSEESGLDSFKPAGISLPDVIEVYKDNWINYDFTKESALVVKEIDEQYDFYINMDNIYLQTEVKQVSKNTEKTKLLKARYKYAMVLIGLSIIGYYKNNQGTHSIRDENLETEIKNVTKMVSPVLLPIIDVLGENMSDIIDD